MKRDVERRGRNRPLEVLLLAGTSEARAIARALGLMEGVAAKVGYRTGRVAEDLPLPGVCMAGESDTDLVGWLRAEGFDTVLDAAHPFDAGLGCLRPSLCRAAGADYLRILRPAVAPRAARYLDRGG